jgi:hypothetical protein
LDSLQNTGCLSAPDLTTDVKIGSFREHHDIGGFFVVNKTNMVFLCAVLAQFTVLVLRFDMVLTKG